MRVLLLLVRRVVVIPALATATVISAALFVLAVVVTGPVSLCLRGRWRAVRLAPFSSPTLRLRSLPWLAHSRSGSGATRRGGATPSAIRT